MATAVKITDRIQGKAGETFGYELSEPFNGLDYLMVSRVDMPAFGVRETRIVPAELSYGNVIALLDGDHTMALSIPLELCSHEDALASIGYEVVVPAPVETPAAEPGDSEGDSPGEENLPAETLSE